MSDSIFGLDLHALHNLGPCHWNDSTPALVEAAIRQGEGQLVQNGALVLSGQPACGVERLIVQGAESSESIDWNQSNRPMNPQAFSLIYSRLEAYLQGRELFVQDRYLGAHESRRIGVRIVAERASHALMVRHLLRPVRREALQPFFPDFTLFIAPGFRPTPSIDQITAPGASLLNLEQRIGLVLGSESSEEIEVLLSRLLAFLLPEDLRLPLFGTALHNLFSGDVVLLLGRRASGKTNLAFQMCDDAQGLELLGDGALALSEGGLDLLCYGSTNALTAVEPRLDRMFGTVIEGGAFDSETRRLDSEAEGRITWPQKALEPLRPRKVAPAPRHLFLLVRDELGVLPPLARMSLEMATQFFALGYGAAVEAKHPDDLARISFATCLDPDRAVRPGRLYARLFAEKIKRHDVQCWIINTGVVLRDDDTLGELSFETLSMLALAVVEGELAEVPFRFDANLGLSIPTRCEGLSDREIDPIGSMKNKAFYERRLELFIEQLRQKGFEFARQP